MIFEIVYQLDCLNQDFYGQPGEFFLAVPYFMLLN